MSRKLPEDENYCVFCEHAVALHGNDFILCRKKGVVSATWVCRKFVYDPLKRKPAVRRTPSLEYVDIDL